MGVIFTSEVQTLSMETQDLQTVHHVEQNVRLLKLGHFLTITESFMTVIAALMNPVCVFLVHSDVQKTVSTCRMV